MYFYPVFMYQHVCNIVDIVKGLIKVCLINNVFSNHFGDVELPATSMTLDKLIFWFVSLLIIKITQKLDGLDPDKGSDLQTSM